MLNFMKILLLSFPILVAVVFHAGNMNLILNLPPEIIVWVFKSLDDIDDALHFARCCKYVHCVFDPMSVRLEIFKSIIVRLL
jgi:hypothetical protein